MSAQELASRISDEQLDLWEHAALLFHNYEWQSAAEQFAELAAKIKYPQLRSLCLLNTVMIMARLGDYEIADSYVKLATQEEVKSSMTAFLAGAVTYELNDQSFAEHCFRFCSQNLQATGAIDLSDLGLKFILEPGMALKNSKQARSFEQPATMYHVPAEFIFEAPQRRYSGLEGEWSQQRHSSVRRFSNMIKKMTILAQSVTSGSSEEVLHSNSRPASSAIPEPLHIPARHDQVYAHRQHIEPRISSSSGSRSCEAVQQSQQRRPKTRYTPRDARVSQEKRMSLANFIKKAGHESDEERHLVNHHVGPVARPPLRMVARNPHGEYESTGELSTFANTYAPETSCSAIPAPLNIGHKVLNEAQLSSMMGTSDERQQWRGMRRLPPTPNHPADISNAYVPSPRIDSGTSCAPTNEVTLEMLQPVAYRPAPKGPARYRRDRTHHRLEPSSIFIASSDGRKSPAGNSSFEEMKREERARALDALEGKGGMGTPEDAQYLPWQCITTDADIRGAQHIHAYDPPSPVPTLNFFEAAIQAGRR